MSVNPRSKRRTLFRTALAYPLGNQLCGETNAQNSKAMNPIFSANLDWPSAIGNFILNYGVLDWHVFVFLERRMPPDQFAKIRKEPFQERIGRVRKLVDGGDFSAEQKQAFEHFFTRLESVRELRNHIAHGHLLVRIIEVGKAPILTLSLPKDLNATEATETRHLEFEEVTKAQSELAALIEDFQKLTGDWHSETLIGHR